MGLQTQNLTGLWPIWLNKKLAQIPYTQPKSYCHVPTKQNSFLYVSYSHWFLYHEQIQNLLVSPNIFIIYTHFAPSRPFLLTSFFSLSFTFSPISDVSNLSITLLTMAENLELDLDELRHLQSIAKRPRVVSLISSEIRNLEKVFFLF